MQETTYALENGILTLVIDVGPDVVKVAELSKKGRSRVVASSGGFVEIPEVEGLRLSFTLIVPKG